LAASKSRSRYPANKRDNRQFKAGTAQTVDC